MNPDTSAATVTEPSVVSDSSVSTEVSPSSTPDSGMDWASRLDSAFETLQAEEKKAKEAPAKDEAAPEETPKAEKKSRSKSAKAAKSEPVVEEVKEPEDKVEPETPEESPLEEPATAEETPKGLTEKAAVKWKELRAQAAEAKKYAEEVKSLKEELEKAKSQPAPAVDTAEVERLKQINAEYEKELSVARVEATQEYKENVVGPMTNVVGFLNQLATKYELNSRDILAAMAESDPSKQSDAIADLAASMNERDRLRLYGAADDYAAILRRRDYFHSSSQERMAKIEAEKQAEIAKQKEASTKSAQEAKAAYEKAVGKVFEDLKKTVPVLADEEVSSDVQRLAKADYSNAKPELKAYLAHSGALLPHVLKAYKEAKSNLEKANKTIASYRNGSPKAGSGSSESAKSIPDDLGFLDALDQQLG